MEPPMATQGDAAKLVDEPVNFRGAFFNGMSFKLDV
jgi:hypothetical protein